MISLPHDGVSVDTLRTGKGRENPRARIRVR